MYYATIYCIVVILEKEQKCQKNLKSSIVRAVARRIIVKKMIKKILQRQFLKDRITESLDDKLL